MNHCQHIDLILWDLLGSNPFDESDIEEIADFVARTIRQFDQSIRMSQLKTFIQFYIESKYRKVYIYNEKPRFVITKKIIEKEEDSDESSLMSLGDMDLKEREPPCKTGIYLNSEINDPQQKVNQASDLVSHRHDYPEEVFTEKKYLRKQKRIVEINKIPQVEQKSQAWLDQRKKCITATKVSTAIDEDPYEHPATLLLDKCGRGEPFIENKFVHHGKKYEDIGAMFYSFRNNVKMHEYGLLQDDRFPFIGASPDGMCLKETYDGKGLTKLVGRLLEIKFPATRPILTEGDLNGTICPRQYYLQCLTQMYVTKMDECDFLQCKLEEYDSYDEFINDNVPGMPGLSKQTGLEKGCIIQLLPKKMINDDDQLMCLYNSKYLYPPKLHMTPEEILKWISFEIINYGSNDLSTEYVIDKVIYWRLTKVTCHLIKADPDYMESIIPRLEQFWNYVEFYREHTDKLDQLEKYIKEVGVKASADIFRKVNRDYLSVHKKSKYKPLYQEVNEWRKLFNEKDEKKKQWAARK